MARIAGVNLPREKRLEVGLTYIYGIGPATARKVCAELGLSPDEKVRDLTDDEIAEASQLHRRATFRWRATFARERSQAIKRLSGDRRLPRIPSPRAACRCNGQRTKTNARTRKGPKKTVGRGRSTEQT